MNIVSAKVLRCLISASTEMTSAQPTPTSPLLVLVIVSSLTRTFANGTDHVQPAWLCHFQLIKTIL